MQLKDSYKNIICIIPARGGSKGIKNKNIISFCETPLIAHTIKQAKFSSLINEVYVSSDSEEILHVAKEYGAKTIVRPKEISDDFASSESALIDSIKQVCKNNEEYTIVFLQATSPLRETTDIDNAIKKFKQENVDSLFSAIKAEDICLWKIKNNLESITYDFNNRKRRQDFENYIIENGSFYITKSSSLIKNNNRLSGKVSFYLMKKWKIHEIDEIDDLYLCEYLYKTKILDKK